MRFFTSSMLLATILSAACAVAADETFKFEEREDRLVISHNERPVATYVFRDEKIRRPYFAHVHAPGGTQVTRHHPPRPGIDAVDHDTMHPGIWLAFGDLGGADFWRNKGRVQHTRFVESPSVRDGSVSFQAENRYLDRDREVCRETARHTIQALGEGVLLTFRSTFSGTEPFAFGDQEEMGLGLRLATPLVVKGGSGTITNSEGGKNENEVWGKQADWCDYSGVFDGRRVGMLLVPHKDNFRRSWFHARDYGFVAANPFGQNAFTKGEKSRIEVKPGEQLELQFGIWIYSADAKQELDLNAIAKEYHRLADLH